MLTRVRIEVSDEASAADVSAALDRYENAVTDAEAMRFGIPDGDDVVSGPKGRPQFAESLDVSLGREVTDEIIEYDPSLPGYKGRRVVRFTRLDTRSADPCTCGPDEGCSDCPPKKFGRITPDKLRGEQSEPGSASGVTITNESGGKFSQVVTDMGAFRP